MASVNNNSDLSFKDMYSDYPVDRAKRSRMSNEDESIDELEQLEREFAHMKYEINDDLLKRIERCRDHHLQTMTESPFYNFLDTISSLFVNTKSSRVEKLYSAIVAKHQFIYQMIANQEASMRGNEIIRALNKGEVEKVKAIIEAGTFTILENQLGPAVVDAADHGSSEIIKILLSKGEIDQYNRLAAIESAVIKGHENVLRVFLEHGEFSRQEREVITLNARGNQNILQLLSSGRIADDTDFISFDLSLADVLSNPIKYLDKIENEGFPENINLLDSKQETIGVVDAGGVRKAFITALLKSLQSKLGISYSSPPAVRQESDVVIYEKLGKFLSKLYTTNKEYETEFLIGPFFNTDFYKILKVISEERDPEMQLKAVAHILKASSDDFSCLVGAFLGPTDVAALKSYAVNSWCLDKDIKDWDSKTDCKATHDHAKCAIGNYLIAAKSVFQASSEELKRVIMTTSAENLALRFQGNPISKESLKQSIVLKQPNSPVLKRQMNWIKKKIDNSDIEWSKRFVGWATGKDYLSTEAQIFLSSAVKGDFFSHTCADEVDLPSELDNENDFLSHLEVVLDTPLNSI